jgi:hypothetical protein
MTGTKGKSGGSHGGKPGPKHKILKTTNPLESFFTKIPTQKQGNPEASSSKDPPRSPDSSSEGDYIEDEIPDELEDLREFASINVNPQIDLDEEEEELELDLEELERVLGNEQKPDQTSVIGQYLLLVKEDIKADVILDPGDRKYDGDYRWIYPPQDHFKKNPNEVDSLSPEYVFLKKKIFLLHVKIL